MERECLSDLWPLGLWLVESALLEIAALPLRYMELRRAYLADACVWVVGAQKSRRALRAGGARTALLLLFVDILIDCRREAGSAFSHVIECS